MLNTEYMGIIAEALSDRTGVKIKAGKIWQSNPKENTLIYRPSDLLNLDSTIGKGLMLHELGHLLFTQEVAPPFGQEVKTPKSCHSIINVFEDIRIKEKLNYRFGGFSINVLEKLDEYFIKINVKIDQFNTLSKLDQFGHLVLMFNSSYNQPLSDVIGYNAEYIRVPCSWHKPVCQSIDREVIKRFNDNQSLISGIIKECSSGDNVDILRGILDTKLYPIIKDYLDDNKQGQDKVEQVIKKAIAGYNPDMAGVKPIGKTRLPDELDMRIKYGAISRVLAKRIHDILKERKAQKWTGNHKQGRLLSKNVYKVLTDDSNLFSRKLVNKPDKYVFYLCLDASGSMGNDDRGYYAVESAYLLKMAFDKIGLPIRIYKYNDYASELNKLDTYYTGGGTCDSRLFIDIAGDMLNYPDHEKIVMVLTDGLTTDNPDRQKLIKILEKLQAKIIGISVNLDKKYHEIFDHFYPLNIKVDKPESLPSEFLRLVNSEIGR